MQLLGFEISRKKQELTSFTPKVEDDGAVVVQSGGVYGTFLDVEGSIRTESELVNKYREMAQYPEIEDAIDDIVNESITIDSEVKTVQLSLDDLEQSDKIKKLLIDEFDNILSLLEFNQLSYEIFKRWYVDGRLYYHAIIDEKTPKNGILELRYIDPRKIRKIREIKRNKSTNNVPMSKTESEYYMYNDKGFSKGTPNSINSTSTTSGIKIAKDSIVHCTSGITSQNGDLILSYLHKAIRPLNILRSMEDSLVIYRVSRAPERRVFYIDVGNLPKMKAEQYIRDMMTKFKNKIVYNSATGEIGDQRKHMSMLEDFWLPRREGSRGTEISTLPGGMNLSQMDDVTYFQNKLYKALNVPITRLSPDVNFNLGRSTEISRDEVKFSKFVDRLRSKFSIFFLNILERQLILKGIITPEDWETFKEKIKFKYATDNYFSELKEAEILQNRINAVTEIQPLIGLYYSNEWVRRKVLKQTDEEIQENDKQIKNEENNEQFNPPEPELPTEPAPIKQAPPVINNYVGGIKSKNNK